MVGPESAYNAAFPQFSWLKRRLRKLEHHGNDRSQKRLVWRNDAKKSLEQGPVRRHIIITPGNYDGELVEITQKGLKIRAAAPNTASLNNTRFRIYGDVQIENLNIGNHGSHVIQVESGGSVRLSHCSLATTGEHQFPAIHIDGGKLDMSDCQLESCCVGLFATQRASVVAVRCEITRCKDNALQVSDGARVELREVSIHDTRNNGVKAHSQANVTLENCEIARCGEERAALVVALGATVKASRSKVHDITCHGVRITEGGHAELTDCEFWATSSATLCVDDAESTLRALRCTVRDIPARLSGSTPAHKLTSRRVISCAADRNPKPSCASTAAP